MTKSGNKTLAAVLRVSRVGGRSGESFHSPSDQAKDVTRVAASLGYDVEIFDADTKGAGVPGSTPFDDRPGFGEALRRVEAGEFAGIIVATLDRLVREDAEKGVTLKAIQKRIRDARAMLIVPDAPDASIDDPDADDLVGNARLPLGIRLLMDATKREEDGKKWKRARRNAVEKGVHPARAPFGYTRANPSDRLSVDPVTGPLLTEAFARRAKGESWGALADWLNAVRAPKRYAAVSRQRDDETDTEYAARLGRASTWKATDVSKLLLQGGDTYLGVAWTKIGGEIVENRNAHPALVDPHTFYAVRGKVGTRGVKKAAGNPLGGGLLRCAGCGGGLTRNTGTPRDSGKTYTQFVCRNRECADRASISDIALSPYVLGIVADRVAPLVFDEPRAVDPVEQAILADAEEKLAVFDATWKERGIDAVDAAQIRGSLRQDVEAARAALADVPVDRQDWRAQVRQAYETWNEFLGREVVDPERAVAEVEAQYTTGLDVAAILRLFDENPDVAADAVRATLQRVVVSGAKGAAEGRVEVVAR